MTSTEKSSPSASRSHGVNCSSTPRPTAAERSMSLCGCGKPWPSIQIRIDSEYFFVNSLGSYYRDTDEFNDAWRDAHKKARVTYRIPYACRHTRAAELLSLGNDPADAAKQMGHSVQMFLTIYSEFIEEYAKNRDKSRFEPAQAPAGRKVV